MYDPFSRAYQSDPFPTYRQLQEADPVHWSELRGAWVLTRYADVVSVLGDGRFSSAALLDGVTSLVEAGKPYATAGRLLESTLHYSDPPSHTRLRRLVNPVFSGRAVECMRPRLQTVMGALLALTPYPQEPDEVYFFANLVSKLFAAEVLGIPWSDIDMLGAWSASLRFSPLGRDPLLGEGPLHPDSEQATLRLQEYFSAHLAQQRSTRSVNLITMLDAVESRGATLSDDDLVSLCIQVLAGSLETLPNFFQNSLLVLSDHPEQWHKLNQDPSPRQSLIDELLRYNKVGEQVRVTTTDVKLGNKVLSRGDRVIVLISAANRDGARFPEPDKFDACRRENRHIAFGSGPHYCLGAALTRLEAEVFVQALRESLS